jgi:hypothetical protein
MGGFAPYFYGYNALYPFCWLSFVYAWTLSLSGIGCGIFKWQ